MKRFTTFAAATLLVVSAKGASHPKFTDVFRDSTLRLDYVFAGDNNHTSVALSRMNKFGGWAGRRSNLDKLPLAGNGEITVFSESGDTLYRHSFSTLYQEWLSTEEAATSAKAMENCFIIPYPVDPVDVELKLYNSSRKELASVLHHVDPSDVLIKDMSSIVPQGRKLEYIEKNGTPEECIDVVITSEGYTADEYPVFIEDAKKTVESLRNHAPFDTLMPRFNFLAVFVPSQDSGVSIPRLNKWKSTAYSSHFSTFYSDRYLTTSNLFDVHNALSGLPYEHLIILANTDEYGGGGIYNSYTLTTAHHKYFPQVVVHEFGHSFGGLADEYFYENEPMDGMYPLDIEPWEPNITTRVDFASKWESMMPEDVPVPTDPKDAEKYPVGLYEGGGYLFKGMFRPADQCRMRTNTEPAFCKVCQAALARLIEFYK